MMTRYAFIYRNVIIGGATLDAPGAVDLVSFRCEVDGRPLGNNEALRVGQAYYVDRYRGGEVEYAHRCRFPSGVWAGARGAFGDRSEATEVIRQLEPDLVELMWRLDRSNDDRPETELLGWRVETEISAR